MRLVTRAGAALLLAAFSRSTSPAATLRISCGRALTSASNSALVNCTSTLSRMALARAVRGAPVKNAISPMLCPRPASPIGRALPSSSTCSTTSRPLTTK